MKFWKWFLKCPLLFLLLAGWAGLAAYTYAEGRITDALEDDVLQNPVFTALLKPDADKTDMQDMVETLGPAPDSELNTDTDTNTDDNTDTPGQKADAPGSKGSGKEDALKPAQPDKNGANKKPDAKPDAEKAGVTRYKKYEKQQVDSPYYLDPGMKALTTEYSYQKVDKDYFDDAVFIGDSRTEGMRNYSGLDNAVFFAKTGLNVYELLEDKFLTDPETGKQASVSDMLKHNQYGKIYLMIGINELGTGNTGTFQKAYGRVLEKFRKWQPDAIIYIQGILPVSGEKSDGDPVFNNININDKNVAISQLADGKNIFYFDVSPKLIDKAGNLKAEYTFDDVHMYARYYSLWVDFLMEHGIVRE